MTHQAIIFEEKPVSSPVSLNDAEKLARLEKNLEAILRQNGKVDLPGSFEGRYPWSQGDKAVSPGIRKATPGVWIFGLKLSTPCV